LFFNAKIAEDAKQKKQSLRNTAYSAFEKYLDGVIDFDDLKFDVNNLIKGEII